MKRDPLNQLACHENKNRRMRMVILYLFSLVHKTLYSKEKRGEEKVHDSLIFNLASGSGL